MKKLRPCDQACYQYSPGRHSIRNLRGFLRGRRGGQKSRCNLRHGPSALRIKAQTLTSYIEERRRHRVGKVCISLPHGLAGRSFLGEGLHQCHTKGPDISRWCAACGGKLGRVVRSWQMRGQIFFAGRPHGVSRQPQIVCHGHAADTQNDP